MCPWDHDDSAHIANEQALNCELDVRRLGFCYIHRVEVLQAAEEGRLLYKEVVNIQKEHGVLRE